MLVSHERHWFMIEGEYWYKKLTNCNIIVVFKAVIKNEIFLVLDLTNTNSSACKCELTADER